MDSLIRGGLGIVFIGLAFSLGSIEVLGVSFSEINDNLLLVVQMGMILLGLGIVMDGE